MREFDHPPGLVEAQIERFKKKTEIEVARRQTGEAIAGTMPTVLRKLMEIAATDGHPDQFKALKLLLDKNYPTPLGERVIEGDARLDGEEVVTEDVREMREQVLRQIQAKEGGTVD